MGRHQFFHNRLQTKVNITLYLRRGDDPLNIVSIKSFALQPDEERFILLSQSDKIKINGISISFLKLNEGTEQEWSKKLLQTDCIFDFLLNHSKGLAIERSGFDFVSEIKKLPKEYEMQVVTPF